MVYDGVVQGVVDLVGGVAFLVNGDRSRCCSPTKSLSRKTVDSRQQLSQPV